MAVLVLAPPRIETKADMAQSASGRAGFQTEHVGYDEAEHHPYLNGERIAASQELGGQEMSKNKKPTRPFCEVRDEFIASMEASTGAAILLISAIDNALTLKAIDNRIEPLIMARLAEFRSAFLGE